MARETERIVRIIEKTFDKHPWYGPSMMEVFKMDPEAAPARMGKGHSIIELVRHMTSWRIFAIKRLEGDFTFEIDEEINFPKPGTWDEALAALVESQTALVHAVRNFPEDRFDELVPSKTQKYTYYTLLHGIVHHDIYHLGQISYIRRSLS